MRHLFYFYKTRLKLTIIIDTYRRVHPDVKATVYVKDDAALVSVGNFSKSDRNVRLTVDWKALGFNPAKVQARIPEIRNFQKKAVISPSAPLNIKGKEGLLIVYTCQ